MADRFQRLQPLPGAQSLLPVDPIRLFRMRSEKRLAFPTSSNEAAVEHARNLALVYDELLQWRSEGITKGQGTIDDRMAALLALLQSDVLLELGKVDKEFGAIYSNAVKRLRLELRKLRPSRSEGVSDRAAQVRVLNEVRSEFDKITKESSALIQRAVKVAIDQGGEHAGKQFEAMFAGEAKLPKMITSREKLRIEGEIIRGKLLVGELDVGPGLSDAEMKWIKKALGEKTEIGAIHFNDFAAFERKGLNQVPNAIDSSGLVRDYKLAGRTPQFIGEQFPDEIVLTKRLDQEGSWFLKDKIKVSEIKIDPLDLKRDPQPFRGDDLSVPIIVANDGTVIEGFRRVRVAKSRGVEELPAWVSSKRIYDRAIAYQPVTERAVSLSTRLWRDHRKRGRGMAAQITKTIQASGSAYDIADTIIGLDITGAVAGAPPNLTIPNHISRMVDAARLANLTGDKNEILSVVKEYEAYADSLGSAKGLSFSLRSATKDFLKKIVRAQDDQIDVVLNRFMLDKARVHARMIARTETIRAYRESYIASMKDKPWVKGFRWKLSPLHPKPDVCDLFAKQDLYGLGPGGYQRDKVPPMPHPNDMCMITAIIEQGYWKRKADEIKNARDDAAFNLPVETVTDAQQAMLATFVEQSGGLDMALDELKELRYGYKVNLMAEKYRADTESEGRWDSARKNDISESTIESMQDAAINEYLWQFGVVPEGVDYTKFAQPIGTIGSRGGELSIEDSITELKRWHPKEIPDYMETVTVLHATDMATAAKFLQDGIIPQMQPWTLTQKSFAEGGTQLDPARGLERGLYVGQYEAEYQPASSEEASGPFYTQRLEKSDVYRKLRGWNDVLLEIQVPKAWLERPAELVGKLDSNVNEALVRHSIPYKNVRMVSVRTARTRFLERWMQDEIVDLLYGFRDDPAAGAAITAFLDNRAAFNVANATKLPNVTAGTSISTQIYARLTRRIKSVLWGKNKAEWEESGASAFSYDRLRDAFEYSSFDADADAIRELMDATIAMTDQVPVTTWVSQSRRSDDLAKFLAKDLANRGYPEVVQSRARFPSVKQNQITNDINSSMLNHDYRRETFLPVAKDDFGRWSLGYDRRMPRAADGDGTLADEYVPRLPSYEYEGAIWKHSTPDEAADTMRGQPFENYATWEQDYFGDYHSVYRKRGARYSVSMEDNVINFSREHGAITEIHNHPGGNTPSPPDVASLLLMNPESLRVAASNGVNWELRRPKPFAEGGWYTHPRLRKIQELQPDGNENLVGRIATKGLYEDLNEAWTFAQAQLSEAMAEYVEAQDPGWKERIRHIERVTRQNVGSQSRRLDRHGAPGSYYQTLYDTVDKDLPQYAGMPILPLQHPAYSKDVEREIFDGILERETNKVYEKYEWSHPESDGPLLKTALPDKTDRARRQRIRLNDFQPGYFDDRLRLAGEEVSYRNTSPEEKRYRAPWDGTLQTARAWLRRQSHTPDGREYLKTLLGPTRFEVFILSSRSAKFEGLLGAVVDDNGVPVPVWEMVKSLSQRPNGRELLRSLDMGDKIIMDMNVDPQRAPRRSLIGLHPEEERLTEDQN